jgi:hypothetical protein
MQNKNTHNCRTPGTRKKTQHKFPAAL